jgi:hypothetical protein
MHQGRPLNQQEIQGIESRVRRNMKQLAQTDTTWQSKTATRNERVFFCLEKSHADY